MNDNVNKVRVLYLSYFFKRNRESYYDLLQQVRDEGDWETWLRFFLQSIVEVAQEATSTARRIVQLREKHRNLIMNEFGRAASSGFKLLEYLYRRPIITVKGATEATGQVYQNANHLVAKFEEHGILKRMEQQERNRRYVYFDYLVLFADNEMETKEH